MMMRDNGTRKNFPPQEKTVLRHQGKNTGKDFKKKLPRLLFPLQEDPPLLMEYSGTVITPSPGSSGDRPAQPPPCRKRHVDGFPVKGNRPARKSWWGWMPGAPPSPFLTKNSP
ncbi:hypothetical protein C5O10_00350 [Akkermansia muciniphila]|nr:hypothetical protein C5O10_00350 [Akkermansia muciniphila]